LGLYGFFRVLRRGISTLKRFDTSGSSSDIGNNWIYMDFSGFFLDSFPFSKDLIPQFPPLTLDLIGFIWIMLISLSVSSPF
jgi:hypothetical protein